MTDLTKPVRVRFAPSPTGRMHLGSARTALFNYLLAHKTGGQSVLRIEDTDQKRTVPGAEEELMQGLRWLGIEWDEGPDKGGPYAPYRQSERKAIYQEYAARLVEMGKAFHCFCTPEELAKVREEQQQQKISTQYSGVCRNLSPEEVRQRIAAGEPNVIRFKSPREGSTTVTDLIRGEIVVENRNIDDYILVKSDGFALYHLAATVDDHLMHISHIFRGSEWLPTFPLHALIHRAFGWEEPVYAHLSVFLKPSGKGKMSKREAIELAKDGRSIFIMDLVESGYVPEAVINWIVLMGWSFDDHTEFFTLPDLVEKFSLDHLNPSPAAINFTKLDHFNGLHIRMLEPSDLARRVRPFLEKAGFSVDDEKLIQIMPIVQERLGTLDEIVDMAGFFFKEHVEPQPEDLVAKGLTAAESAHAARLSYTALSELNEITHQTAEPPMRNLVDELGIKPGQLFGILRVAVTGQKVSPPLFESMEIIGSQTVLERLQKAVVLLEGLQSSVQDGEQSIN
jgi:glutamyl-tRNA synthetase